MLKNTKNFLILEEKIKELNSHKLFKASNKFTKHELKIFMESHVFAVWDFMSIVKSLQHHICPSNYPWKPSKYTKNGIANLINEIVLSEESDHDQEKNYFSHFDLYLMAMNDIGADSSIILEFIKNFSITDLFNKKILHSDIPKESIDFLVNTFKCLNTNSIANIAAIFTYGRETNIPIMFSNILRKIDQDNILFINLKLYINRHIEIDSVRHGPLSLHLFNTVCENNQKIYDEAIIYAIDSIDMRIQLWDGVFNRIKKN